MQPAAHAQSACSIVALRHPQLAWASELVAVPEALCRQAVWQCRGVLCRASRTGCALAGGILSQSWEAQLLELEARLAVSSARMKLVVGHHPVRSRRQARPLAASSACACRLSLENCLNWGVGTRFARLHTSVFLFSMLEACPAALSLPNAYNVCMLAFSSQDGVCTMCTDATERAGV